MINKLISLALLLLTATHATAHDNQVDAIDITHLLTSPNHWSPLAAYSTQGATADGPVTQGAPNGPNYNVWFKFAAPNSGRIRCRIVSGENSGTLQYGWATLWDSSNQQRAFSGFQYLQHGVITLEQNGLTPDAQYYISVDNFNYTFQQGTFRIGLDENSPVVLSNDNRSDAIDITPLINGNCSASTQYSTIGATPDLPAPQGAPNGPNYNVWFKFIAPPSGTIIAEIVSGPNIGTMQFGWATLWDSSDTQLEFTGFAYQQYGTLRLERNNLLPGLVYYISVDNFNYAAQQGTFTICMREATSAPANHNRRADAVDITHLISGCSGNGEYSTIGATADGPVVQGAPNGPNYDVWFKFIAPLSGKIKVEVKTGGALGTMEYGWVTLRDTSNTQLEFSGFQWQKYGTFVVERANLTPGQLYYVSVDNFNYSFQQGTFTICLTDNEPFPLVDRRGRALVIVDNSLSQALANDIIAYKNDLIGDGWDVTVAYGPRHDDVLNRNTLNPPSTTYSDSVDYVKEVLIRPFYDAAPSDNNVVVLLGHLPVPYSGIISEDGHPEHSGAWPADAYYGDMTGLWRDDISGVGGAWFWQNSVGDGWFAEQTLPAEPEGTPGKLELSIGRIDFSAMRGFVGSPATIPYDSPTTGPATTLSQTEVRLLHNYLIKARRFRNKQLAIAGNTPPFYHNIIDSGSGHHSRVERVGALAQNSFGYSDSTFRSVFGPESTPTALLGVHGAPALFHGINTVSASTSPDYWKHFFPGSEIAFPGILIPDLPEQSGGPARVPNAIFVSLWGSYMPDWQHIIDGVNEGIGGKSPFLKSLLASRDTCLVVSTLDSNANLGRFARNHHYGTVIQDTLSGGRMPGSSVRTTFCLGDPTLHAYVAVPPSSLSANSWFANHVRLTWSLPTGSTAVVDRSDYIGSGIWGPWIRIAAGSVGPGYMDDWTAPPSTLKRYRVRGLEQVTIGNKTGPVLSQGKFITIN